MPLRWDPLLVRALAAELDRTLSGARVRAVRMDGANRDLVVLFREHTLAWPLHPTRGAPLLLPATEPGPADLPLAARVRRVRAPDDERVLIFELLPSRGGGAWDLLVELLGNQWNALVTDAADGRARHVLVRREGPRPIRVGETYAAPAPSHREGGATPLTRERWLEILEPVPPPQRARVLVQSVAWTSTINADALTGADRHEATLEAGYDAWRSMAVGERHVQPVLLTFRGSLQPYPWPLPGHVAEPADTLLDAFRMWAERETPGPGAGEEALLPPTLVSALERAVDGARRRATSLVAELAELPDEAELRGRGDLLLARFGEVPSGVSAVTLTDFQGEAVTIPLDPTASVQQNASACYDQAAKVERARRRLPAMAEEATAEAAALEALLERARRGEATPAEIDEVLPRRAEPTSAGAQAPSLPYRVYRSSGGLEIRVGRGSRRNDDLTFHHSAPDDVWMHARHAAGAHVVLRWGKPGNPPARDLQEAAVLAALNSKARTSGSVPVDWTLRKYVRKPRGAAAGAVVPQRVKTLFVEPDPALAERLAEE